MVNCLSNSKTHLVRRPNILNRKVFAKRVAIVRQSSVVITKNKMELLLKSHTIKSAAHAIQPNYIGSYFSKVRLVENDLKRSLNHYSTVR